ncbi:hypothetical protein QBC37DRAFT_472339 [Rhypophila decipiens]|uniref:Flap structure-specific endonuclease n=1 Tax=Rhypophila decipiens TaxID=261697 RepID=A0AAN6YEC2_9PEZI|nr:hypothetical protein QBC37DRAFT_472339 [Rhypophila decipiens]
MGIKGIYKEIGPGQRIALSKLAIDHLEKTGRPFRLAIDFSIWQFQVQAARGGSNPAIRTLFYRLVRLLGLAIQPIFVFDGPNKPAFKRNKRSGRGEGTAVATAMAKRMIRLFGLAYHDAPGEAEAECALLQREGVVDAVLSEDVDTIMFGCRRTLRNWTAESTKGSKTPTHVSMYEVDRLSGGGNSGIKGLDREGMVLVALMSGGDYLPEGVPGCGVKVACEAARAGFGTDLCRIKRSDKEGLGEWRERLLRELRTNESGFFRTKHKALEIPEGFPDMEVLRYYTHPVVSQQTTVDRVKAKFPGKQDVDLVGLREFVRETFDWTYRAGAVKLIRNLAPGLLVQLMLQRMGPGLGLAEESTLVKGVSSRRTHFSTDATPELRISFVPTDIVGLDLEAETEEQVEAFGRTGIALNSDDEFEEGVGEELEQSAGGKTYDPSQPDLAWIPEVLAKLSIPQTVELFEDKQRAKVDKAAAKAAKKPRAKKSDMPVGAIDKYLKTTKATPAASILGTQSTAIPAFLVTQDAVRPQLARAMSTKAAQPAAEGAKSKPKKSSKAKAPKPTAAVNPWSQMGSQISPRITKTKSATNMSTKTNKSGFADEPILISSSPAPAPTSPARDARVIEQANPTRKRTKSPPTQSQLLPDPFGSPPSPSPCSAPGKKLSTSPPPQFRKPKPFKRTNSGAEDGTIMTQSSIKAFGKVTPVPDPAPVLTTKNSSALIDDDDDPFASSPPRILERASPSARTTSMSSTSSVSPATRPPASPFLSASTPPTWSSPSSSSTRTASPSLSASRSAASRPSSKRTPGPSPLRLSPI